MKNLKETIPGTENFTWGEFVRSMTAQRRGINNIPEHEEDWNNIQYLASNVLQPIRNEFGPIRITSGYRSPELNVTIGGSPRSFHCYGMAADIEPVHSDVSLLDIMVFVANELRFTEAIAEYWPYGWNHLALAPGRENEMKVKLKDENHNYERVGIDGLIDLYGA